MTPRPRSLAVPVALVLDAALGEPPAVVHPVVWIGRAISVLERVAPGRPILAFMYGSMMTAAIVGGAAAVGAVLARLVAVLPRPVGLFVESWLLKTTFSVRALIDAGHDVEASLEADDLPGARTAVTALVSRDATNLDGPLLASAAIESLAENTADSVVAPLLFYAVAGLPGAFAYRAANTLDATIGYRGRYEYLGKSAARLDDVLNLVPARLSALLLIAAGALGGGDLSGGVEVMLRDCGRTASPNAGWPMSAMAGLLGTRLEKPGHYVLGDPLPPPDVPGIDHAAELVKVASVLAMGVTLGLTWAIRRTRSRSRSKGVA